MNTREEIQIVNRVGVCGVGSGTRLMSQMVDELPPGRALDVGTGTGYIAIYLAKRGWTVDAVDISSRALENARENARRNAVELNFFQSNLLDKVTGPYDAVAFNAPMRMEETESSRLATSVLRKVRPIATILRRIFGKSLEVKRLPFLKNFVREAGNVVRPHGRLFLGIGLFDAKALAELPEVDLVRAISVSDTPRYQIVEYRMNENA